MSSVKHLYHGLTGKRIGAVRHLRGKKHMKGGAIGTLLLDGGLGGGSSYSSIDDYMATTGRDPTAGSYPTRGVGGAGLGGRINSKLSKLSLKLPETKRKPQNIRFNL